MSANDTIFFDFHKLPKKIFTEIASYLSFRDLKVLSVTSKGIKKLIDEDPVILSHFPLQLSDENCKNMKDAKKQLTRAYTCADVYDLTFTKNTALWLTSNFCCKLRFLNLSMVNVQMFVDSDAKLWQKTLMSLHSLEELTLVQCNLMNNFILPTIKPVTMECLKKISFDETHLGFLKFMKTPELQQLEICKKEDSTDSSTMILSFLATELPKLRFLSLHDIDFNNDFRKGTDITKEHISNIKVPQLRKLSLSQLIKPFQRDEYLLMFIEIFAATLEELNLNVEKLPNEFFHLILTKFINLKALAFCIGYAPKIHEFYSSFAPNTSIKTLILHDTSIKYKKPLKRLLTNLVNLERLIIPKATINRPILKIIEASCKNLKTLECFEIENIETAQISMPKLTKLSICQFIMKSSKGWKEIVKSFPNIEDLSLHIVNEISLNEGAFKIITKGLKNIQHVGFGVGFKATKNIFNELLTNCKNLKKIEVISSAFRSDENLHDEIAQAVNKTRVNFICYRDLHQVCPLFDAQGVSKFLIYESDGEEENDDDAPAHVLLFGLLLHHALHNENNDSDNDNNNGNADPNAGAVEMNELD